MTQTQNASRWALPILISNFFFWGFMASSIDILIPVFKEKLNLTQWIAQNISFVYYGGYTVGSLIYFIASRVSGGDLLNRIGYKNGIAIGLVISALGTLLFYPAAENQSFNLLIAALFVVVLGFSLQQTAANPLAIVIGDPKKGSQRLSLAGGINNIGSIIGPLVISYSIFGGVAKHEISSVQGLKIPYLILGAAFIVLAIIFRYSSIPNQINMKVSDEAKKIAIKDRKSVFNYPQLVLGMLAIFFYVGVEVTTATNLPEYMRQHLNTPTSQVAPFVSLYWASLMIGRWTSSVGIYNVKKSTKQVLHFVVPYLAFGFYLLVNYITGHDVQQFYMYSIVILALIFADLFTKGNPARQLLLFSLMGIIALMIGILSEGTVSVYAFISVGLFCSTLWPCIFTLAIAGLGKHTNEGSGLLIMMIMGGGFISKLQGFLADDKWMGIQWSYMVGVACFAFLAFYAVRTKASLKQQGIDYDKLSEQPN